MKPPNIFRQQGDRSAALPLLFQQDADLAEMSGGKWSVMVAGGDAVATESLVRRYPPGDLAMWIFILAELLVFAIFFSAYAFARMRNPELFDLYQALLNRDAALINTLALLTSSAARKAGADAVATDRLRVTCVPPRNDTSPFFSPRHHGKKFAGKSLVSVCGAKACHRSLV